MNEYQGYTLTDITINSDMSLTGKIYYGAEFKSSLNGYYPYSLINKFHAYVDHDLKQQSELTNCQNFANELVELCKKHRVKLESFYNETSLYLNGYELCNVDERGFKTSVHLIDEFTDSETITFRKCT